MADEQRSTPKETKKNNNNIKTLTCNNNRPISMYVGQRIMKSHSI